MLSGPVAWLGLVVVEGVEWSSGLVYAVCDTVDEVVW